MVGTLPPPRRAMAADGQLWIRYGSAAHEQTPVGFLDGVQVFGCRMGPLAGIPARTAQSTHTFWRVTPLHTFWRLTTLPVPDAQSVHERDGQEPPVDPAKREPESAGVVDPESIESCRPHRVKNQRGRSHETEPL